MYKVVVKGHFSAAHKLPGVLVCEQLHGHTFQVEVSVSSLVLDDQSMVTDFRHLKDAWNRFDHQCLNDFLGMPTAEVIAAFLYNEIQAKLVRQHIEYVRVWESQDAYAEYSK